MTMKGNLYRTALPKLKTTKPLMVMETKRRQFRKRIFCIPYKSWRVGYDPDFVSRYGRVPCRISGWTLWFPHCVAFLLWRAHYFSYLVVFFDHFYHGSVWIGIIRAYYGFISSSRSKNYKPFPKCFKIYGLPWHIRKLGVGGRSHLWQFDGELAWMENGIPESWSFGITGIYISPYF